MSLIKRLMMTPRNLPANDSNGAQPRLLVRLRDSDLWRLRFITHLLMKLKASGSKPAPGDAESGGKRGISHDLTENNRLKVLVSGYPTMLLKIKVVKN